MKKTQKKNIKIPDMSEVPFENRLRILMGKKPKDVKFVVREDEEGTKVSVEKIKKEN